MTKHTPAPWTVESDDGIDWTVLHNQVRIAVECSENNARLIAAAPEFAPRLITGDGSFPGACIIASGVAWAHTGDWLEELGLLGRVDFFQVTMPYPLNRDFIQTIRTRYEKILVIDPNNKNALKNIAVTYTNLGNPEKAKEYISNLQAVP